MSKGSKRRPGVGYESNWERIFNAKSNTMDNRGIGREHAQDAGEAEGDRPSYQEDDERVQGQ
jgi:hypothetical protein